MNRDRHSRRHNNSNWKNNNQNSRRDREHEREDRRNQKDFLPPKKEFHHAKNTVTAEQIREEEEKIREFKSANQMKCCKCGEIITDITQAMTDKATGEPMHFDCALELLSQTEKTGEGDKIIYIGQGRFGVVHFDNPHDMKHFKIHKVIEWEERDKKSQWRSEMSELYSQVK